MTSLRRSLVFLGLGLFAACCHAVVDSRAASPGKLLHRVDSVTEFYGFGGIHIATNHTSVEFGPDSYAVTADTTSSGLADLFVDLETHSEASGTIVEDRLRPRFYRGKVHRNGTDSYASVEHRNDGGVRAAAIPPSVSLQIDPATIARTTDQMTAFLSVERQVAMGRPCTGDIPVFDGRHLYTLHFHEVGSEPLELARTAGFDRSIRVCHMVREAILGFADAGGRSEGVSSAAIYYALLLGNGVAIPLHMNLQTEFGPVTARLVELRVDGAVWQVPN
jgi:hypothetical protein